MEIRFSKNDYKEINQAIQKIELFQLETFLSVIGKTARIPDGHAYYYLENLYYHASRNGIKEARKIVDKYPRKEPDTRRYYMRDEWTVVLFGSVIGFIAFIVAYLTRCYHTEKFVFPGLPERLILIGSVVLFTIFKIAGEYYKYKDNQKRACYEAGKRIIESKPEVFEMLDELHVVREQLGEISESIKVSNSLEARYRYGTKPTFEIDMRNTVTIRCGEVNVMLNDATWYKRDDYFERINMSDEEIEKTFHDKIVDFTWLDGEANSELVDVAEICKKYNLNLDTIEKLEEHETYDGKDDDVCVVYDE